MSENPYQPPGEVPDSAAPRRWPYLGWLAPVVTWVPALLIIGLGVPRFLELFDQLRERAELPSLTSYVLAIARFSRALFHVPIALILVGLIASDLRIADQAQRRRSSGLHKLWQMAICVCGMTAALLIVIGLLLPIIRMHPVL